MTPEALDAVRSYLLEARWFGGKGREVVVDGVRRIADVEALGDGRASTVHLVDVSYPDAAPDAADARESYQLPLVLTPEPDRGLDDAFVGWWDEPGVGWVHAYDAVRDPRAMATWLRRFARADERPGAEGELTFRRLPGHELDADATPWLFSGEQSNSSVFFGEDALLKVFRKVTPGPNPDITTHERLTEAGSEHVAALYGWLETVEPGTGAVLHLGMLQQFLRTATDGWDVALASVRNLFAEADLHADEVGGDFAGESARLGEALADVHAQLRTAFGVESAGAETIAAQMDGRLDEALTVVPDLAPHETSLRGAYAALAGLGEVPVQRIHADLHLGQTLRTVYGWKLVDFEGEPARPLVERLRPDSPWRDVAGMLRSFDYAPHAVMRALPERDPDVAAQRRHRAEEWAARNKTAFLDAYAARTAAPTDETDGAVEDADTDHRTVPGSDQRPASGPGLARGDGVLVAAYVADKAVYECVYEARNRPSWLSIPLTAVARIGT